MNFFVSQKWLNSPYINHFLSADTIVPGYSLGVNSLRRDCHFLSADTIVPGYANPQNLNCYSYVLSEAMSRHGCLATSPR